MKEYKCLSCGNDYSEPELSIFCCSVDPKDAELTKLKSDVERLRKALDYTMPILERFVQNNHKIAILNTKTGKHHCGKEAIRNAARALEETK